MDVNVSDEHEKFITENWRELNNVGDGFDAYETVFVEGMGSRRWSEGTEVVTMTPDGKQVRWYYDRGLTEYQDSEFGTIDGYVERKTKTVERVFYV